MQEEEGEPTSITTIMKLHFAIVYTYSNIPLSGGALCTSELDKRRKARITVIMMIAVYSCRETD
jgi:hypothetical protein